MRFSVDAHAIGQHLTGNETYIRNLLKGFALCGEEAEFIAYISRSSARDEIPAGFAVHEVSVNPFARLGFDLPRLLLRHRPGLLHVQYTAPAFTGVPVVVSVHDISYLSHPHYFTRARAVQLNITVRSTVKRAAAVLTPSEFSRRGIIGAYGLPDDAVHVIPNGVSSTFRPVAREVASRKVSEKYGIPAPYILTVGDLQPRKNHAGLFRAFEDLMREYPALPHRLVVTGKRTWYGPRVYQAARDSAVASRIHFTDFVDDDDLVLLYGGCDLFVFPSFYEGFGLPIIEAMACGRAVACSDTSAMPEVADSAALLFDPYLPGQMARAMRDLLIDSELRARMERLGLQRAAQFSWQKTAERTLRVYHAVVGSEQPLGAAARTTAVSPR
jgi:glycosyltransferase involved in cell wall biosynthesis